MRVGLKRIVRYRVRGTPIEDWLVFCVVTGGNSLWHVTFVTHLHVYVHACVYVVTAVVA